MSERKDGTCAGEGPGGRPAPWRRAVLALALAALGWGVLRASAGHPDLVERWYSRGLFPPVRDALRWLAAGLPISLAEVLLLALAAWASWLLASASWSLVTRRRGAGNLCLRGLARVASWGGFGYALFLFVWGFNHARRPYAWHAGLEVAPVTREELRELTAWLVEECNRLGREVTDEELELEDGPGGVDPALLHGFEVLGEEVPTLAAGGPLLRRPWISPLLSALGITGIYCPFTAEAHLNRDVPLWTRPFASCHEIAHQKGFAREDEAHCIAWQACRRSGDAAFEYSASLVALGEALAALATIDPAGAKELYDRLEERSRRDREKNREYWLARRSPLSTLSRKANDAYLRSQGQEAGVRSYGRMVDLLVAERR